ncbi:hypothetical protein V5G24_20410 [Xanthobacter sp. VTT E-85241]|jgi:hypothetical protein|uniref:hypothetical protein n=1 Tax=Roseixanthobacter finlandensis TaxID=3119922 RepID=UPI00372AB013
MDQAKNQPTTSRRRPEDAAAFGVMLLKGLLITPPSSPALVKANPKLPVLTGGVAAKVREDA